MTVTAQVEGRVVEHEVVVRLSFPVSAAQAAKVLERWWRFKEHRKGYMRDRRAGRLRKAVAP